MRIRVRLFAAYRERVGRSELEMDMPEGATAGDALRRLAQEYPALQGLLEATAIAVNREYVGLGRDLKEGDEVALLPPVSGGGPFEVTTRQVTADELIPYVVDETVGAVVTFVGVVRGFSRGKKVSYLEYEAYPEMAEAKLAEIGEEIRQRWQIDKVAIVHRVGRLEVGETAVVIAVGSPHRREAFAACQYAIDRIKQIVPIWKKEVWEDGEVWIGREE